MRVALLKRDSSKGILLMAMAVLCLGIVSSVAALSHEEAARGTTQSSLARAQALVSVPGGLLVWVVPDQATTTSGDCMSSDGDLFARIVDSAGDVQTYELGKGVTAHLVCGGASPVLLVEAYNGEGRFVVYEPAARSWRTLATVDGDVSACTGSADSLDYILDGSTTVTSVPTSAASTIATRQTRSVPSVAVDSKVVGEIAVNEDQRQVYSEAGLSPQSATVATSQLVRGVDGLLAFECTGLGSGVGDVEHGSCTPLPGIRWIDGACLGGDGSYYVLGDVVGRGTSQCVLRLDGDTRAVEGSAPTGWAKNSTDAPCRLNSVTLLPTASGVFLCVIEQPEYPSGEPGHLLVWNLNQAGVRKLCEVPNATGMKVGYGKGSTLLLFCGPAGNKVSRLDPLSGATTALPDMSAPEGSFVVVAAE
jgi:hypothetical protein